MLRRIFLNDQERRLRTLWRLLLNVVVILAAAVAVGLVALAVGELPEEELAIGSGAQLFWEGLLESVAIVGAVLFCGWLIDRRRLRDFGLRFGGDWWRDLGFGLALGALLMGGVFLVELWGGWIELRAAPVSGELLGRVALAFAFFVCVGVTEEMLMRGYELKNIAEGFRGVFGLGPRGAIVVATLISSLLFAGMHVFNPHASVASTVNLALAGVSLAAGMLLTGELAIPIGFHISWNFVQGNVFGFPVSGNYAGVSLIEVRQGGPAWWTGGEFGPEAGWIGIAAELVGILLIILWVRWTRGRVRLHTPLATPELNLVRDVPLLERQQRHVGR